MVCVCDEAGVIPDPAWSVKLVYITYKVGFTKLLLESKVSWNSIEVITFILVRDVKESSRKNLLTGCVFAK